MEQEISLQLSILAGDLLEAKNAEDKAKSDRIEIEERISALLPGPEKGSKTTTLPDGTKITIERGLNYKAELEKIRDDIQSINNSSNRLPYLPPIKQKTTNELDVASYEWFRDVEPKIFNVISKHVIVTPKKVSVSIKTK